MSSILTNNSAMVALQTLQSINKDLNTTQSQISTGKKVGSAADNAAVWAISKTMQSDVAGFQAVSESLDLGRASVAVARNAAETTTDLLTQMKQKIVAAQGENVDRNQIQADIDQLRNQIDSVNNAAQFNGLNLVRGQDDFNIQSSLDRSSDGSVNPSTITVNRQDLSTDAGVFGDGTALTVTAADGANSLEGAAGNQFSDLGNTMAIQFAGTALAADDVITLRIADTSITVTSADDDEGNLADAVAQAITDANIEGVSAVSDGTNEVTLTSVSKFDDVNVSVQSSNTSQEFDINSSGTPATGPADFTIAARASTVTFGYVTPVSEGDSFRVSIAGANYDYVAGRGETYEDVAKGLKLVVDSAGLSDISTNVKQDSSGNWFLQVDNDDAADVDFAASGRAAGDTGVASGGLIGLDAIDVTTDAGIDAAIGNIETLIQNSIDASAAFGSVEGRINIQSDFVSSLTDSLKSGIGALVDTNMEEASARLQALQVQQQLGVQSLSIANQAPQTILALFR